MSERTIDNEPFPGATPDNGAKVARDLKRYVKGLSALVAVLIFLIGGIAIFGVAKVVTLENGLCAFKSDLSARIETSRAFITDHPDAIEKLGYSISQAQKELVNQERTLHSFDTVSC